MPRAVSLIPTTGEEVIREQEGSGDDLEEPLLIQAHRMNHSTEAEETMNDLDRYGCQDHISYTVDSQCVDFCRHCAILNFALLMLR